MFNRPFTGQTHFIGALIPPSLSDIILECRAWMHEQYGCRSGYGTPPHITLIPPFHLPSQYTDADVRNAAAACVQQCMDTTGTLPFTAHINGFGAFGDRTLFAHVISDKAWDTLHAAIYAAFHQQLPDAVQPDRRPFTPHLTVANRDIPEGASFKALQHFNASDLNVEITIDTIGIFKRTERGTWQIADTVSCPE